MTRSWHDLYRHGERLNVLCKSFMKQFRNAEERDDHAMMIIWGEALRKATANCVEVAKTVLAVEEIVNGKRVINWKNYLNKTNRQLRIKNFQNLMIRNLFRLYRHLNSVRILSRLQMVFHLDPLQRY